MSEIVCVLGAGSFGTALAKLFAEGGHRVTMYARDRDVVDSINTNHVHPRRLQTIRLPPGLHATNHVVDAVRDATLVVTVIPTIAVRSIWEQCGPHLPRGAYVLSATKGIENTSLKLVSDVLHDAVPEHARERLCYLSGPSFATELARRVPTAVTLAAHNEAVAAHVQRLISTDYFRAYTTTDVAGVELGGALKNVIAIATGCADGLGFGYNTMAALMTRGLAEITRLAVRMGAQPLTLAGLAGMGDLVLTCTGPLSRNRTVGVRLGQGHKLDNILHELGEVAEGVNTARSVLALAKREGVEVPICEAVHRLLFEGTSPRDEMSNLMGRKLGPEIT
jgi:glycerol-3-phosphate dehydrogenase (NAD(P)+)